MAPPAVSKPRNGIDSKKRKREDDIPTSKRQNGKALPPRESPPPEEQSESADDGDDDDDVGNEEDGEGADDAESTKPATKSFKELGIIDSLCEACESLGYKAPTPIQSESIPIALQGRDLIGLAETGSGKTAAFALPILQALMAKPQSLFGLILAPTRELAYQISKAIEALGSLIAVRTAVIVGGMDMVSQAIALGKKPHIIVATPGRLMDHLENTKGFSLRGLKYLVMDEADRLLDLDFGPILDKILALIPKERRTYLFSATMTRKVEALQRASLVSPVKVSVSESKYATVKTLLQKYMFFPQKDKDLYLIHTLTSLPGQRTIIFTRTVNEAQRLSILLRTLGFSAVPLHGQLSQSARLGALNKFTTKSRDILVATDVAARGLDIPTVDLVINHDLPDDSKTYIHRVGRTARAGKSGQAISFVTQYDVEVWQRIEASLGKQLEERTVPSDEVLVLGVRVGEAQRVAIRELKDEAGKGRGSKGQTLRRGKMGRRREGMDKEEG